MQPTPCTNPLTSTSVAKRNFTACFYSLYSRAKVKNIVALTTGMAEIDFVNFDTEVGISYVVSRAALNVINAKFNINHKNQGNACPWC